MWQEAYEYVQKRGVLDSIEEEVYPFLLDVARSGDSFDRRPGQQAMLVHFSMWLSCNPSVTKFRVVMETPAENNPVMHLRGGKLWILFSHKRERGQLARWVREYRKWFVGEEMEHTYVPTLPMTGRRSLSFVAVSTEDSADHNGNNVDPKMFDKWQWVMLHCSKPVYRLYNGLAFTEAKEAVHFKLRWC